MCATFSPARVRKLTGKPAFLTIADCESETRRIHKKGYDELHPPAAESNAFRIHSDLASLSRLIAARIARFSSVETLACIRISRNLALRTFGLPIFVFI